MHRTRAVARLRPAPGRKLPRELRADRIGELAAALPGGVRDPGFAGLLARIDDSYLHTVDRLELFVDGERAMASASAAIEAAEHEILIESYILRDDGTGLELKDRLAAARERGVRVCVLADAIGSFGTASRYWKELESHGVEVRLFHRLLPHPWYQFIRDHRKIVVVDRRIAFVGGMNIADEYGSSRRAPDGLWRDTHVRVEGTAAQELAVVFAEGWHRAGGRRLEFPAIEPRDDGDPRVLVLDSRPGRGHAETASVLAAILAAARRTAWITNAYFAPPRAAVRAMADAVRRGVDVRLLLPGPTDIPILRHAGHGYYEALLARGIRIFEYQPAVLHAKTLVADDYVAVVGSSNLDFRSFRYNAECNLVILDEEFAGQLAAAFETDLENAVEIDRAAWARRPLLHRWGDAAARALRAFL